MKGMKRNYDKVLKKENTAIYFSSFKYSNWVQKMVARMLDDMALGEWEWRILGETRWNHNFEGPIKLGFETSSNAWDYWCGIQPMPFISYMALSIALTVIFHRNTCIPKCTLCTGGWKLRMGHILEDNKVLIDVESTVRVGNSLVPMIVMSEGTHFSNFAGNKRQWPVYMTIGNLSSKICQIPSMHRVVMVTLLLIPIQKPNIPQMWLDEQRLTNWEVVNKLLQQVLQPLIFKYNSNIKSRYYQFLSPDGNFRCFKLH